MTDAKGDQMTDPKPLTSIRRTDRSTLASLCHQYRDISFEASALAVAKKALMADIRTIAEANHIDKVEGDGWRLTKVSRETKSISAEILLGKGVTMAVVEAATIVSTSSHYRVSGVEAD